MSSLMDAKRSSRDGSEPRSYSLDRKSTAFRRPCHSFESSSCSSRRVSSLIAMGWGEAGRLDYTDRMTLVAPDALAEPTSELPKFGRLGARPELGILLLVLHRELRAVRPYH